MGLTTQDIAAIVEAATTVMGLTGIFLTLWHAASVSNREKSCDTYLFFANKYDIISEKRQKLHDRFLSQDSSLSIYAINAFIADYLRLYYREFELYRRGLVDKDTFLGWSEGVARYLSNGSDLGYFDANGRPCQISPKEAVILQLERFSYSDRGFRLFVSNLADLSQPSDPKEIQKWQGAITAIVNKVRRTKRLRP